MNAESESAANLFPLAVCVLPAPPQNRARTFSYGSYVHEILHHAGLRYSEVSSGNLVKCLPQLKVLVTVGETEWPEEGREQLQSWVHNGGAWLSVGGVCGMPELFGAEVDLPSFAGFGGGVSTLGEGYLQREGAHPIVAHLQKPLHFFNGIAVRAKSTDSLARVLDAHGRLTERAAVLENAVGAGRCLLIAPDVTGTIVHVQQGRAVTRDGVPAPDGSAPTADGVQKSDDGMVLDWILDRDPISGVPGLQGFLHPVADCWREVLLRAVFHLASQQNVMLPLLWLYPRDLLAIGHISLDTDGNDPTRARHMLAALAEAEVPATWCTILPGYDAQLTDEIQQAGHELAMHFDAMSEGMPWDESSFDQQWRALTELFGGEAPTTNKNHYLRWQGDTEFFAWCVKRGIQFDQSKGTSKSGEAGFNFGTCHPFFPVEPSGELIDVLELPTPTQDLTVFAPLPLLWPLLHAAQCHHGVLHLLFHPAHIDKPGVADAIKESVAQGRVHGLEWWTARQINDWERARRQARWTNAEGNCAEKHATMQIETALPQAKVLWLRTCENSQHLALVNGQKQEAHEVERWGFNFLSIALDAAQPGTYTLELQPHSGECQ